MLRTTLLALQMGRATALDNGVGLVPAMGYNTWNDFRCSPDMNAAAVMAIADKMVELGLDKLGYRYLNLDDCWQKEELTDSGELIPDPVSFPDGIKPVADYVHSRGLLLGIYSCRGWKTCAFRGASSGHEATHARQFAEWGVDYLKHDSCWASGSPEVAFAQYGAMRDALNATGRQILYSLCGWSYWYAPKGAGLSNSWRISADCDEWSNVYVAVRTNERLAEFARPGAFNDPDMLLGSSPDAPAHLTPAQVQSQFSLWAVMAAPLLIGSRLLSMPRSDLATYTNPEVISVSQDALGVQGTVVASSCPEYAPLDNWWMSPWSMPYDVCCVWTRALATAAVVLASSGMACWGRARTSAGRRFAMLVLQPLGVACAIYIGVLWAYRPKVDECQQVWARPLAGGAHALCFVNFAAESARVRCDAACLAAVGLAKGVAVHVRDLVGRADVRMKKLHHEHIELELAGGGTSALWRIEAIEAREP